MSVFLSPNLPANVVEIGNEISQAKINEINAGTLATQTWVTSGFAPKASPTFTGTVTIPAGASISGYLTIAQANSVFLTIGTAASTYMPISGMGNYATTEYVTSQGYITDAPSDGSEYVRKNAAWAVATGGGGGSVAWGGITGTVTDQTDLTTYISGLGYQTASDVSTYATANFYPLSTNPAGYLTSVPPVAKTVTTYTSGGNLSTSDVGNIAFLASGGMGFSMTVLDDSSVGWSNGNEITIVVDTLSSYSVQGGMGVTINGSSSATITSYVTTLVKVSTNIWYIS